MSLELTVKQKAVLQFIVETQDENGFGPTIREIANRFDFAALKGATNHLDALSTKGYIKRTKNGRSITAASFAGTTMKIPELGQIAAGFPITAIQNVERYWPIPYADVRNIENAFLLRVKGDSMIGALIKDGDLVLIRPQKEANNGEIVAVRLGEEATLKRFHRGNDGKISLRAENPQYSPIVVEQEDSEIIGKMVKLYRDT